MKIEIANLTALVKGHDLNHYQRALALQEWEKLLAHVEKLEGVNNPGGVLRDCDNCGKQYTADPRNLKRGWGLCCSKSCAAQKREKSKPGYDPKAVEANNRKRENWFTQDYNYDPGDSEYWDNKD